MVLTAALGLLGGLLAGNGLPHFVAGVTGRDYPALLGDGPVPNALGGWVLLVLAALVLTRVDYAGAAATAFTSIAAGVLAMALFHAAGGAHRVNRLAGRSGPAPRATPRA
ncbi:hypothetical protein ACFPZ0_21415 [Streptomonospora nanhaiensis]|uniref:hypothetical protein n=1 Tax=Streptomonospora nanhaiensis TaxID=1323731 RepID=UPI001C99881E|nr:hypothetical protein [Streptomonospora nanhaiensis]MBX9387623.1 hypothetical protein [Streptomonospora nanhaiensis]